MSLPSLNKVITYLLTYLLVVFQCIVGNDAIIWAHYDVKFQHLVDLNQNL